MLVKFFMALASIYGLLGVALGAFGAHALKEILSPELKLVFETAAKYQMYHVFALFLSGGLLYRFSSNWFAGAGICFSAGIFIFSGSLYVLALTGVKWWGAITPIGGILLIGGWSLLLIGFLRFKEIDS